MPYQSQDANSQQKETYETQSEEQKRLLQSANGKLKTAVERSKSISLELMKAKDSILINDAASKERKKESDEKINLMEIALSEAKLNNQIANNTSALKSNEAEYSKTTQTEPISANEENSEENNPRAITWEEFDIIASRLNEMCHYPYNYDVLGVYVDEFNIYIRKNPNPIGNNGKDNKGIKNLPPMDYFHGETPKNSGLLLIGTDGTVYSPNDYGSDWKVFKDGKWYKKDEVEKPSPTLPRNGQGDNGMKEELVKAIRENDPKIAMSNFDYAGNMTESILLGNVAMQAGGKFTWDAENLKTNRADTDQLISKVYRAGWDVAPA